MISFMVTVKLICVFVFAYAKVRFSQDKAQIANEMLVLSHMVNTESNMSAQISMNLLNLLHENDKMFSKALHFIFFSSTSLIEPHHEKTRFLHMQKQRCRSASRWTRS